MLWTQGGRIMDIMDILYTCKMQIACLLLLMYVGYIFIVEGCRLQERARDHSCNKTFDRLFIVAELSVLFDGITGYTVNNIEQVTPLFNSIAHLIFLLILEVFIFLHFMYWMEATGTMPKNKVKKAMWAVPMAVSGLVTLFSMPTLSYAKGEHSDYSVGIPVYSCYACVAVYCVLTVAIFLRKSVYLERRKKTSFLMAMITVTVITGIQFFAGESLFAALAVTLTVISIYLVMENPAVAETKEYHKEMIMGFATLIENKDNSTGGHIKRTSIYAEMIAKELRRDPKYHSVITKDFMENLKLAAPMHDIGKISIPDVVLQKPGKLTDEEYAVMKTHSAVGGKIILETFGHMLEDDYRDMAYQVAYYHHEKWNGRGYPEGISGTDIPLPARIMAVADVFDAVSAKRCYRDALPLETCFDIIEKGRGTDFDPDIVDAFMKCRGRIEEIAGGGGSAQAAG